MWEWSQLAWLHFMPFTWGMGADAVCVSPTGYQGHPAQVGASDSPQGRWAGFKVGPLQG